ncbi:leucine-rich repeat domain-containing protein [Aeoliella sp.]|uniref:leucine-rich repeat domain-containing protein n=1 Tax=Aeoliella sp. TaxID=2795800 RepID=UPI003CCBE47B
MTPTSTTTGETKEKCGWLRFRLRTLLVLTTVICVWLAFKAKVAHDQRVAVAAIREVGGEVLYDYQFNEDGAFQDKATPWAPAWLRNAIGEDYFVTVVGVSFLTSSARGGGTYTYNTQVTDATLRQLIPLRRLRYLFVRSTQVTDDGLETIGDMQGLERLRVSGPRVTDVGVAHLARLERLKLLSITAQRVSDAAMPYVARIESLEDLEIRGGQVTNDGLIPIKNLPNLRVLTLYGNTMTGIAGTQITDAGLRHVAELKQLEVLWINNMEVTHFGLGQLEQLSNLRSVNFFMTSAPLDGLETLQQALPKTQIHASSGGGVLYATP